MILETNFGVLGIIKKLYHMTHSTLGKKIKKIIEESLFLPKNEVIENLSKRFPFAKFSLVETRYEKDIKYAIDCIYEYKVCRFSILHERVI